MNMSSRNQERILMVIGILLADYYLESRVFSPNSTSQRQVQDFFIFTD